MCVCEICVSVFGSFMDGSYVSVEFTPLWVVAVCLPNLAEGRFEST